jgi:hypothetical protein
VGWLHMRVDQSSRVAAVGKGVEHSRTEMLAELLVALCIPAVPMGSAWVALYTLAGHPVELILARSPEWNNRLVYFEG